MSDVCWRRTSRQGGAGSVRDGERVQQNSYILQVKIYSTNCGYKTEFTVCSSPRWPYNLIARKASTFCSIVSQSFSFTFYVVEIFLEDLSWGFSLLWWWFNVGARDHPFRFIWIAKLQVEPGEVRTQDHFDSDPTGWQRAKSINGGYRQLTRENIRRLITRSNFLRNFLRWLYGILSIIFTPDRDLG